MNTERCLRVATRIDALLIDEIGEGIDTRRMADDALYARDVLLVCDALDDGAGPRLAHAFRFWAAAPPPAIRAPRRHGTAGRQPHRVEPFLQDAGDDFRESLDSRVARDTPDGAAPRTAAAVAGGGAAARQHGPLVDAARRWLSPQRWLHGR